MCSALSYCSYLAPVTVCIALRNALWVMMAIVV